MASDRSSCDPPVVYGEAVQLATLLESITKVIESEPREMFAEAIVQERVEALSGTIRRRVDEAMTEEHR